MEIIETPIFTSKIKAVLSDDEYCDLQWTLVANPEAGRLIPGCGGLQDEKIYMLFLYKKSEQQDLTKEQMKILTKYVKEGVI